MGKPYQYFINECPLLPYFLTDSSAHLMITIFFSFIIFFRENGNCFQFNYSLLSLMGNYLLSVDFYSREVSVISCSSE